MGLKFGQSNRGLVWTLSLLWASHSFAQDAEVVEWEFLSKDGVAERRPQPLPQVIPVGDFASVTVRSEVLGPASGRRISVDKTITEGMGGLPATGEFGPISDIVEDPAGQIWVIANGGLCRFDGQHWTLYSQADGLLPSLTDLEFDAAGNIWLVSSNGVTQFDGRRWIQHRVGRLH